MESGTAGQRARRALPMEQRHVVDGTCPGAHAEGALRPSGVRGRSRQFFQDHALGKASESRWPPPRNKTSFPLDSCGRLATDVIDNTRNTTQLIDNPV